LNHHRALRSLFEQIFPRKLFVFVSLRENRCTLFKDHALGSALLRRRVVGNRLARQW
jgi:hypothetical protein